MSREQLIERIQRRIKLVQQEDVLKQVDDLLAKATQPSMKQVFEEAQEKYGEALKKLAQ